jgi:hypothetical protein
MRFHEYETAYQADRGKYPREWASNNYYNHAVRVLSKKPDHIKRGTPANAEYCRTILENNWYYCGRPYYTLWPAAMRSLGDMKFENVPLLKIKTPEISILIRFAFGKEPAGSDGTSIKSILASSIEDSNGSPALNLSIAIQDNPRGVKIISTYVLIEDWQNGGSVSEVREELKSSPNVEIGSIALRYVASVCLLADDPSLIEPDVLSEDRQRYDETNNVLVRKRLEERAIKRGKRGWTIGRKMEELSMCPHYRRPHPAIYWCGPGGANPEIRFRPGGMVKPKDMAKVPTGYLDKEEALAT